MIEKQSMFPGMEEACFVSRHRFKLDRPMCLTCMYFTPETDMSDSSITHQCKRFPPSMPPYEGYDYDDPDQEHSFPWVAYSNWCGEYARNPEIGAFDPPKELWP